MSRRWRTLFSCCLLSLTAFPGNTYGWVYYVSYLKLILHISYGSFGIIWLIVVTTSSATLPFWGWILKCCSEREVLTVLSLLFVACIASIAVVESIPSLVIVLFALRSLQGGLSAISAKAINSWFCLDEKEFPSSLVCGCNFLTELFPALLGAFFQNHSIAHIALAEAGFVAVLSLVSVVCFSNRGTPKPSTETIQEEEWDQFSYFENEVEALGSPATVILPLGTGTDPTRTWLFWLIVAIGVLYQSIWSAVSLFTIELFKTKGIGELRYVNAFFVIVSMGSIGCFVAETCLLRLYRAGVRVWVMATHCFLLTAACCLWFAFEGCWMIVIVFGLSISSSGAFSVMYTAVFSNIWGTEMEGWMYSLVITLTTLSAGLGPIVLGRILDMGEKRYLELMFLVIAAANAVVGIGLLWVYYCFWMHDGYQRIESTPSLAGSCVWS